MISEFCWFLPSFFIVMWLNGILNFLFFFYHHLKNLNRFFFSFKFLRCSFLDTLCVLPPIASVHLANQLEWSKVKFETRFSRRSNMHANWNLNSFSFITKFISRRGYLKTFLVYYFFLRWCSPIKQIYKQLP